MIKLLTKTNAYKFRNKDVLLLAGRICSEGYVYLNGLRYICGCVPVLPINTRHKYDNNKDNRHSISVTD